jgi:CBS domain-containing protein
MQVLKNVSIGEVLGVERRPLITTEPTALLETVSKQLRENNIMSVPVFDPTINKFTGIIDAFDLLR